MIAETRTTKALRNVVFALTLTLTGATSMTNSSVAQAQTSSPTTTGVMVILTVKAGVAAYATLKRLFRRTGRDRHDWRSPQSCKPPAAELQP
jgi:hypothetical protein